MDVMKLQVDLLAGELYLEFALLNLGSDETSRDIDTIYTFSMGRVVWPREHV